MRRQLTLCWSQEIEHIVQTMVYEDQDGQMHDILHEDHHAQVLKAMWHEPASETWARILCRTMIVAAGPIPSRANTEFAATRQRMVEAAAETIKYAQVRWIPETIHDIGYHRPAELATIIRQFLD